MVAAADMVRIVHFLIQQSSFGQSFHPKQFPPKTTVGGSELFSTTYYYFVQFNFLIIFANLFLDPLLS